jgi:RNA polymerase sigma-70 factor (ECF subfamily)
MTELQQSRGELHKYEEFLNRFTRDRERIFAFVHSLIPRHSDAEDVFQQCSLILWRKFGSFQQDQSFLAWACGIARFEVCNYLRTTGRDRLRFDDDLIGQLAMHRLDSLSQYDDRLTALRACLKNLTDEQRELLDAAYGNGVTVKRLAELTGKAVQTFYNRLGKLRIRLLDCVQSKLTAKG